MALFRSKYPNPETGERIQSKVWWFEFIYDGKRIRKSAKTTRKTIAAAAEKDYRRKLERARAGLHSESNRSRIKTVSEVLGSYRNAYKVNKRPKSVLVVQNRGSHLERLLGPLLLSDVTADRVVEYMTERLQEGAGNRTVNMELGVLSRSIGHTWKVLWPKADKLEENNDVGRALEQDEERAILDAAARSRSKLIHPFLYILCWTGLRSNEARTLQWLQIDFETRQITVGKSKSEFGAGRQIPMTAALLATLTQYRAWYESKLGPAQPDWYVFPLSNRIKPVDPTRPVTSLKRAWEGVRKVAKVSCRLHDCRHTFCTKLAEAGIPESTMLDMMGHMSAKMLRRYSHIRDKARRAAIAAIEARDSTGVPQESPQVGQYEPSGSSVTH
jgi:integrase